MKLTDLQLECMRLWADKTLSMWCLVEISDTYYDAVKNKETNIGRRLKIISNDIIEWDYIVVWWIIKNKILNIIWHPITRWRLCYLYWSMPIQKRTEEVYEKFNAMQLHFILPDNTELLNQSILERPEELQLLVRDFLLSIQ